eukprot:156840_1
MSWYSTYDCIAVNQLEPLWLVGIGMIVQTVMTVYLLISTEINVNKEYESAIDDFMLMLDNKDPSLQIKHHNPTCYSRYKQKRMFKMIQIIYVIWKFISIIIIFVLDVRAMVDIFPRFSSTWDRYQCYAAILLTSSNAKTIFCYSLGLGVAMYENYEKTNPNTRTLVNKLKIVFVVFVTVMGFYEVVSLIPWILVGYLAYFWIFFILTFAFIGCLNFINGNCSANYNMAEVMLLVCFLILMAFWLIISSLAMVNLYSGMNYSKSLNYVFTERHWETYLHYTVQN